MVAQMVQNSVSFTISVQSYLIHIQSSFLYSVSHPFCIQFHLIYILSTYISPYQNKKALTLSMDWFLYDNGLRHERVKSILS